MAPLTAWTFPTAGGADNALKKLPGRLAQQLIQVQVATVVSWETGRDKPPADELRQAFADE
jgi:uncharacterized membrane protein